jgi:hypothetical protein
MSKLNVTAAGPRATSMYNIDSRSRVPKLTMHCPNSASSCMRGCASLRISNRASMALPKLKVATPRLYLARSSTYTR